MTDTPALPGGEFLKIQSEVLAETIETLERLGCAGGYCDGPTLEPVDMVTCFACETLAKLRSAAGLAPRRDDDRTWEENWQLRNARYSAEATGRSAAAILDARGFGYLLGGPA